MPVERDFIVRSWRREHGLPDNEIRVLRTSRGGYLWVGTRAGLARFDGMEWRVWRKGDFPELASDDCLDLIEDSRGNICVTTTAGLTVLGPQPWQAEFHGMGAGIGEFEYFSGLDPWEDTGQALVVAEFEPGRLLVGTPRGVFMQAGANWEPAEGDSGITSLPVSHCLQATRSGVTWVGHRNGLSRIERTDDRRTAVVPAEIPEGDTFTHALACDRHGTLWAVVGRHTPQRGRLLRWEDEKWQPAWDQVLSNGPPLFLFAASDGSLWFPDGERGLIRWFREGQTHYLFDTGRRPEFATAMTEDHEGNLWVGTETSGLLCLQPRRIRSLTTTDSLPDNNCWAFAELPDGALAIGTESGLCIHRPESSRIIAEQDGLARNEVRALTVDARNRLWIGTHSGLNVIESN
ncbi:MAG: hypothetical protein KDM81_18430, partial [Verrucomicrobiae bacterium]|nr:hypothetical protein [Verrucomicrobiae bacterium]